MLAAALERVREFRPAAGSEAVALRTPPPGCATSLRADVSTNWVRAAGGRQDAAAAAAAGSSDEAPRLLPVAPQWGQLCLTVHMGTASVRYGSEYSGSGSSSSCRLAVTPLVDRCFLSCMAALAGGGGGLLHGGAGSGKAHTARELASAMAMQVRALLAVCVLMSVCLCAFVCLCVFMCVCVC